jgi:hypothetical protein
VLEQQPGALFDRVAANEALKQLGVAADIYWSWDGEQAEAPITPGRSSPNTKLGSPPRSPLGSGRRQVAA